MKSAPEKLTIHHMSGMWNYADCVAACLLLAVGVFFALPGSAQINDARLPIILDAESTIYDGKNSILTYQGLRVTQGNIGIQADSGQASKLDFEDSVWHFSGNVIIDTEQGRIECDTADLQFKQHELQLATIAGNPATFELRRPGRDDTTYAEAKNLFYDFSAGVIEFSGDAVITEGGNQISSNFLVYNIKEQRINAQSAGADDPRVKITYTPRVSAGTVDDAADSDAPESQNDPQDGIDQDTSASTGSENTDP